GRCYPSPRGQRSHPKLCTRTRGCLHPLALFLLRKLTKLCSIAAETLSPRGEGSRRRLRGRSPHLRGTSRNRARFPHLFSESSGRVSCFGRSPSRSARDNWASRCLCPIRNGKIRSNTAAQRIAPKKNHRI